MNRETSKLVFKLTLLSNWKAHSISFWLRQ